MGLDDLFQGAGDGIGISSGEDSSFADGFTPGGGFASNGGTSTGFGDAASGITSGGVSGVSGDFLQQDPAGGYSPPGVISQHPNAQTLEVRNPVGGYSPSGVISLDPNARTLEVRTTSFANMGGVSGKGLFPSLVGMGGGSGLGGSLLTPSQPGRPSFNALADQPPFGSLADQPSLGSLTDQPSMSSLASLAGGGIHTNWNSGGGSGATAIGKPAWGHDGRLPDDVRYSTSAIGDPMGLFGQTKNAQAIGNSEPGQGGIAYDSDPFGPSPNTFVNSYEATAGEKKDPEYQPHWSTQVLFTPGMADASGGGGQGGIKPSSGDKMIASYEAAQGLQGEGGVLLAAAKAGKTATDAGGELTRNVNNEQPQSGQQDGSPPTADQKASIEEQRRQWEFDKGLETEAKRKRTRPTSDRVNSPYRESRLHPTEKKYKPHRAIDLRNPKGGAVVAASDGTVKSIDNKGKGNLGNHVIVDFDDGMRGVYGHTAPSVKPGQRVRKGDPVGNTDLSGATTGPHLHFEVHDPKTGKKINPEAYLPQRLE